jgi:hypothetical protein
MKKIEILNPVKKKKGLSKKELDKILKKWQKKLDLDSWKMDIKIVDFKRKDYRQSGDFRANRNKKQASIFLTVDPFLRNQRTIAKQEERTILHELIHIFLWEFDSFAEKTILKDCEEYKSDHLKYLEKLEKIVDSLTLAFLKK